MKLRLRGSDLGKKGGKEKTKSQPHVFLQPSVKRTKKKPSKVQTQTLIQLTQFTGPSRVAAVVNQLERICRLTSGKSTHEAHAGVCGLG